MKSDLLERIYLAGSGTVFLLVAVFHLFRLIFQWPIIVGTLEIPYLLSYTGLPSGIAASILAFWLFRKKSEMPPLLTAVFHWCAPNDV